MRCTDEVVRTGAATDATFAAVETAQPPRDIATALPPIGHEGAAGRAGRAGRPLLA